MPFIDAFLNRITMYRLVLYYLVVLWCVALGLTWFGVLPFTYLSLIFSTALILAVCWATNAVFAKAFNALPNVESVYITSFILALIVTPPASATIVSIGFIIFVSAWAMASKYIFAVGKTHLFNPAAFAIAVGALALHEPATWWVGGNLFLLPFVVIGGLLIVRKIRRFDLVLSFLIISLITIVATARGADAGTAISQAMLHSPIFFLGFVMLTEPLTMPSSRSMRVIYGALVGFLFAPNVHFGSLYLSPELALLVGNIFAYLVNPKGRFMLTLVEKKPLASGSMEYVFRADRPLAFSPGQYLEWTVPHAPSDSRGNRRYFTIASAPGEKHVRLGVKFHPSASTFKNALSHMEPEDLLSASHIAGEFVLPKDPSQKLVFIAGGIGITPFRSQIQHLLDTQDTRSVVLLYSTNTQAEIAYKELFDRAEREIGLKTVYALTSEANVPAGYHAGFIDAALIQKEIPDYLERTFYISGPHGMVESFKKTLRKLGISRFRIKTDYFPGF